MFLVCLNIYFLYFHRIFIEFAIMFLRMFVFVWFDFAFFAVCVFLWCFIAIFLVHFSLWLRFCLFLSVLETKTQYWSVILIWFSYPFMFLDCLQTFMDFGCCQPGILFCLFCVVLYTYCFVYFSFWILFVIFLVICLIRRSFSTKKTFTLFVWKRQPLLRKRHN